MKNFYSNSSEARIDIAGLNFLIVYGNHMNGGWCAILNWKAIAIFAFTAILGLRMRLAVTPPMKPIWAYGVLFASPR